MVVEVVVAQRGVEEEVLLKKSRAGIVKMKMKRRVVWRLARRGNMGFLVLGFEALGLGLWRVEMEGYMGGDGGVWNSSLLSFMP